MAEEDSPWRERLQDVREKLLKVLTPRRIVLLAMSLYALLQQSPSPVGPVPAPHAAAVSETDRAEQSLRAWNFGIATAVLLVVFFLLRSLNERQSPKVQPSAS